MHIQQGVVSNQPMMMPQQAIQNLKPEQQQMIMVMNPQTGAPMHVSAQQMAGYAMQPLSQSGQMPAGPGQIQAGHMQGMVADPDITAQLLQQQQQQQYPQKIVEQQAQQTLSQSQQLLPGMVQVSVAQQLGGQLSVRQL